MSHHASCVTILGAAIKKDLGSEPGSKSIGNDANALRVSQYVQVAGGFTMS